MAVHALIRDAATGGWHTYREPLAVLAAETVAQVPAVVEEAETRVRRDGVHAVGFLTYEAAAGLDPKLTVHPRGALPPAWFALFAEPRPAAEPGSTYAPALTWEPSLDAAWYRRATAVIRDFIAAGDTYQVNFSYRLRTALEDAGPRVADALFRAMIGRQPGGLGAFVETDDWALCCASHELFFSRRGRRLTSRPMKGTAPRGVTADDDARYAAWLSRSIKNRAENLMITDMVRNDLSRLADIGSVRTEALFRLEPYPTLWQMTSTVHGDTDAGLCDILRALFPAASITGAPKRRTMEIIAALEQDPREIYTGTIGTIAPDGAAQFNVAIRTAFVDKRCRRAEYGVGGGIVWDSDPAEELEETRTKARILEPGRDGEFALLETLLWRPDAGVWLLDAHLERLQAAARHFFHACLDEDELRRRLDHLATGLPPHPHRLRLLVDSGLGVRLTATLMDSATRPSRVVVAGPRPDLRGNPYVTHKTTRRGIYDAALCEARQSGADDVVLVNDLGEITESSIANVVADLDGARVTPPVACGLLPGVYRRHLLDSGRVVERVLHPEDLSRADAVYLANSVRGLWQVELIGP